MKQPRWSSERGAMLIFVAVTIAVLVALSAFVVDMGVNWFARVQAQNAADAGALAGAIALAYDNSTDLTTTGPAYMAAMASAQDNTVYGVSATPEVLLSGFTGPPSCTGASPGCVQVNVYRDSTHGSAVLPTYFAGLLGVSSQNGKATATAQVLDANATKCLKPWMIADKGSGPTSDPSQTYGPGDFGTLMVLRQAGGPATWQQADFNQTAGVTCQGGGAACYDWAATHCVGGPSTGALKVGDPVNAKPGQTAGKQQGAINIFNQDPSAYWDPSTKTIKGTCAKTDGCAGATECANPSTGDGCANGAWGAISPRLVPVGLFDPAVIQMLGNGDLPLRKIAGMFMLLPGAPNTGYPNGLLVDPAVNPECFDDKNVCAFLAFFPAQIVGPITPATGGSLAVIPLLVR